MRNWIRRWCVGTGVAGLALSAAGHVDLSTATVTVRTAAKSSLVTTGGSNVIDLTGGTGAFPSWTGFSDAGQAIGLSSVRAMCDFSLFLTPTEVITNGFANSRVIPGADFVDGSGLAESGIEIAFHVHGAHHFEIYSVDVGELNGEGTAYLTNETGEVFRYTNTHIHEIRGDLPEGEYTLVLLATTAADAGGAESVGRFELEFEIFEGALCLADLNGDRFVDDADFVEFAEAYDELLCPAARHETGCPADFNEDRMVDDADFIVFAAAYNDLICP